MYITFFQKKHVNPPKLDFRTLWENPYQELPEFNAIPEIEKVTHIISHQAAATYFYKHHDAEILKNLMDLPVPCELKEIPTMYRHFQIPKRTDPRKKRDIDTPKGTPLETYLQNSKYIIENTLHFLSHDASHGYVQGRSTVTERQKHQENNSKWFLYLDLKDFFPSHNKDYCMRMLKNIYPFGVMLYDSNYRDLVERMIDYALLNDSLPQGTPLSPTLTNVLMTPIDYDIATTLRDFDRKNLIYTRYADDIAISCKQKFSARKVIKAIEEILEKWQTPFKLNTNKIKYGSSAGKNYHLGTIINKDNQLKLGHKKNQKLRAAIFQYGMAHVSGNEEINIQEIQKLLGNIAYAKSIDPDYINYMLEKYSKKFGTDIEKHMIKTINGPSFNNTTIDWSPLQF